MLELLKMLFGEPSGILIIAVVVFVAVWGIKQSELVGRNLLPLVAMVVGTVLGAIVGSFFGMIAMGAIEGFIAGGFASGAYDAIKGLFSIGKETQPIDHKELDEEFTPPEGD